jgi:hypothetical protein
MGGEEAIGAAAGDSRIAAVIAEGALARTDADKAWLSEMYGIRGGLQLALEWVQYSVADWLTPRKTCSPGRSRQGCRAPAVPPHHCRRNPR